MDSTFWMRVPKQKLLWQMLRRRRFVDKLAVVVIEQKNSCKELGTHRLEKLTIPEKKVGKECQDQRKMLTRSVHKQTKASMCRRLKKSQHRREVVKSFLHLAFSGFLETRKSWQIFNLLSTCFQFSSFVLYCVNWIFLKMPDTFFYSESPTPCMHFFIWKIRNLGWLLERISSEEVFNANSADSPVLELDFPAATKDTGGIVI